MIRPLDITALEEAWDLFRDHGDGCSEAALSIVAHWLGQRAGLMLREIRILRTQVEGLQAALDEERAP